MTQWRHHYSDQLPSDVSEGGRAGVEFIAGRVPVFLDKFLNSPGKSFSEREREYLSNGYLSGFRFLVGNEPLPKLGYLEARDDCIIDYKRMLNFVTLNRRLHYLRH